MAKIKKVVFPVAGLGTRFLPATKASPKEMLPIVDRPLIQYATDEAVDGGGEQLVFITGRHKRSIEDHYDKAYELEHELADAGKKQLLNLAQTVIPEGVHCIYVRQPEALGLGHAVLCAEPVVGNDAFAIILADDLIRAADDGKGAVEQMAEIHERTGASVICVEEVPPGDTDKYGIVETERGDDGLLRITSIVEKPEPSVAPSNLAVVGRYLLTGTIFKKLHETTPGAGGEIQLTDAIAGLLKEEVVIAHPFTGKRYDCGSKDGYLQATVEYALEHPELGATFRDYLKTMDL
jgi:UTP--glucose-1-phosphate uridylyltransferase